MTNPTPPTLANAIDLLTSQLHTPDPRTTSYDYEEFKDYQRQIVTDFAYAILRSAGVKVS